MSSIVNMIVVGAGIIAASIAFLNGRDRHPSAEQQVRAEQIHAAAVTKLKRDEESIGTSMSEAAKAEDKEVHDIKNLQSIKEYIEKLLQREQFILSNAKNILQQQEQAHITTAHGGFPEAPELIANNNKQKNLIEEMRSIIESSKHAGKYIIHINSRALHQEKKDIATVDETEKVERAEHSESEQGRQQTKILDHDITQEKERMEDIIDEQRSINSHLDKVWRYEREYISLCSQNIAICSHAEKEIAKEQREMQQLRKNLARKQSLLNNITVGTRTMLRVADKIKDNIRKVEQIATRIRTD